MMHKVLWFKKANIYDEYPLKTNLKIGKCEFLVKDKLIYFNDGFSEKIVNKEQSYVTDNYQFIITSNVFDKFKLVDKTCFIGPRGSDVVVPMGKFLIENETFMNVNNTQLYVNGRLLSANKVKLFPGIKLLLPNFIEIIWQKDIIGICAKEGIYSTKLERFFEVDELPNYPNYKRSPRIIKKFNTDEISISKIPAQPLKNKNGIFKIIIPPITIGIGTITMSIIMGRGLYMLIGLGATIVTTAFSLTTYISEKRILESKNTKRKKQYEIYLLKMRKKLFILNNKESKDLEYNYPKTHAILSLIENNSSRIYERNYNDHDFLNIKVGVSKQKAYYKINLDYDQMEVESESLTNDAKSLVKEYTYIDNKPNIIDLKKTHLGIVGEKKEVHLQLKNLITQLTFFHSYHDLQIICLYSEEYKNEFDYLKWYPHVKLDENNLSGNIYNEQIRDQVIGSIYQIIKNRKIKYDEVQGQIKFKPHYAIIVDDLNLIMNHSIMEYLHTSTTNLGFSLIYTAHKRYNLPENIHSVVVMDDSNNATLLINEKIEVNEKMKFDDVSQLDFESSARSLNALNHITTQTSQIPEKLTFLELYHVEKVTELNVAKRWFKSQSHKSLAVPLGFRSQDDIVYLNLHEKAHGPHGLVAGTTGSGKSEIIQSYILSLGVNFSPHEVGFLLIDYKGGGMANLFKDMPHLLGTITNLDGSESMRALASIKAELARRQVIFNEYNVNNINLYNRLFKMESAKEALPHLFIISDEFAELKKQQPEFMSELISVARIGRTLGVHLILATQKPTGVVDEQIWSNAKFKLALKVSNENDSKEILKTEDAAFLTQPGRAYLQVGNNEVYELFQSAWSGAPYVEKQDYNQIDNRIYKVNDIGQGELINEDLSFGIDFLEQMNTQLDAVVKYIKDIHTSLNLSSVKKTWLPILEQRIISPYKYKYFDLAKIEDLNLNVEIGLVDIPEKQQQVPFVVDFINDGNLSVFASSGYGKSTTLTTIIMALAQKNNPLLASFYILDFGNLTLNSLKHLPHVHDYITFDEEEKQIKFFKLINDEIKRRKTLISEKMVQNFEMYNNKFPDSKINALFIVVDNFDVVKEIGFEFEDLFVKLTRDGSSLGIYVIISTSSLISLKYGILNNLNTKIIQNTFDDTNTNALLGRSEYVLNDVKGRALIKQDIISVMQVYLAIHGANDLEYNENLNNKILELKANYTGKLLKKIPILPTTLNFQNLLTYKEKGKTDYVIGLNVDTVEPVYAPIYNSPFTIIGGPKSGKTNVLKILLEQINEKIYLFDSHSLELVDFALKSNVTFVSEIEERNAFVNALNHLFNTRYKEFEVGKQSGKYKLLQQYVKEVEKVYIIIDDINKFAIDYELNLELPYLLEQVSNVGINIITTVCMSKYKGYDNISKFVKTSTSGIVLTAPHNNQFLTLDHKDYLEENKAYMFTDGIKEKILLPKFK